MDSVTVYTALYNLDRVSIDSRSFSSYIEWLISTIELFPGIVVFHGGELDDYNFQNCNLVKVPLQSLDTLKMEIEVTSVLSEFKPHSPNDITFRLPMYSLLQFAKFEFARLLESPNESVMWVDAGISRFVDQIDLATLNKSTRQLLEHDVDAVFEIDIRNNLKVRNFTLSDSTIGSCRRVVSGGAFWIRTSYLEELCQKINEEMEGWLQCKVWDNEQVLLRKILPFISAKIVYVPQIRGVPGCVPRSLSHKRPKVYRNFSRLIGSMLRRGILT
jgi:hypothetical protein